MIIITAPVHESLLQYLAKSGYDFRYEPVISYADLLERIHEITGLFVTTRLPIDENLLSKANALKWIGRLGSGMENIDTVYANAKGIRCESSPEGNRNAVAEHCLGLLLSLMNKINIAANEVRNGIWKRDPNRGTELSGKTVGIIGYGNTGEAFARLLSSFDVKVLAYDKYCKGFGGGHVYESTLEEVCTNSDVISFHLPLTAETRHFAGAELFGKLKTNVFLLNTSRGNVIDTAALISELKKDRFAGVGLDVLENESLSSYNELEKQQLEYLTGHPKVIITPHIAGYSHEAYEKMATVLINKLGL